MTGNQVITKIILGLLWLDGFFMITGFKMTIMAPIILSSFVLITYTLDVLRELFEQFRLELAGKIYKNSNKNSSY